MKTIARTVVVVTGLAALSGSAACGGDEKAGAPSGAPEVKAASSAEAATTSAAATAAPTASAAPAATASAASTSAPEATSAAAAAPKTFDCGARGQKPCPMQGWMKTVMANAASSGKGDKLAAALTYVATHVPPGYDQWAAMANEGAKKAKAGDIEGAKRSCKECHDVYKQTYKATLRDRPY